MYLRKPENQKQWKFTFLMSVLILIIAAWYGADHEKWKDNKIIDNDACIYYAYLPAAFIYHDLTFKFAGNLPPGFEGRIWTLSTSNGSQVLKMSCGNAIAWLPFFGMAHLYATLSNDYPADGYAIPYSFSIFVAALFYLSLGLFFLGKLLLKYFHDLTVGIVLLFIVLATNLLYYVIQEPGTTHITNFGFICTFLYMSVRWLENPTYLRSIIIGLLTGLIVLIRPTNFIVILLPLLIGISNWHDILPRITFFRNNITKILIAAIAAFLVFIPQLIYWKYVTGQFVYYSYQDQGFFFNHPHIIDGLFSYRKGWLLYTPLMAFAIAGFFILKKYARGYTFAFSVFMAINIYVIFSWWNWWYGGSFGSRPMIDSYGIMAFPLAAFIEYFLYRQLWVKVLWGIVFSFILFVNQYQMNQYFLCIIHWESMSQRVYWSIFLTKKTPANYQEMLQHPNIEKAIKGLPEN
jgi:hypothetical protein